MKVSKPSIEFCSCPTTGMRHGGLFIEALKQRLTEAGIETQKQAEHVIKITAKATNNLPYNWINQGIDCFIGKHLSIINIYVPDDIDNAEAEKLGFNAAEKWLKANA